MILWNKKKTREAQICFSIINQTHKHMGVQKKLLAEHNSPGFLAVKNKFWERPRSRGAKVVLLMQKIKDIGRWRMCNEGRMVWMSHGLLREKNQSSLHTLCYFLSNPCFSFVSLLLNPNFPLSLKFNNEKDKAEKKLENPSFYPSNPRKRKNFLFLIFKPSISSTYSLL